MTIATVRTIISDKAQYDRSTATGDGATVEFELPNSPVSNVRVYLDGTLKTLTTHYTLDADLGLVTFVTAPGDGVVVSVTYQYTLLSDDDLTAFLTLEGDDDKLAAAAALDAMASNEAIVQKKVRLLDVQTDGPAVAKALREHAAELRRQVREDATDGAFDWAEHVFDDFSARERLRNQALRGVL